MQALEVSRRLQPYLHTCMMQQFRRQANVTDD